MIYEREGHSIPQRIFLVFAQTVMLVIAAWLLLGNGIAALNAFGGWDLDTASLLRRQLLFACCIVLYGRMLFTTGYLLRRAIGWEEALTIPLAFALYYIGFALLGGTSPVRVDALDGLALGLFITGSCINTGSEILRDRWKRQPEHRGRLYTGGLFRYSRHANYFGDLVWVSGWALLTRNPWATLVPILLFLFFYFYNAPQLDRHLESKYPEFAEYRRTTRSLIPFVL